MTEPETKFEAKPASRVVGLDVARGLLMAYVIIVIHGTNWLVLLPYPQSTALLFEMPLIFMVSGAAYYHGQVAWTDRFGGGAQNYLSYLLSRGVRILAPYFGYALVAAVVVIAVRHINPIEVLRLWLDPYLVGGRDNILFLNWHLWFVSPFLGVTIVLPFLARLPIFGRSPLWLWAVIGLAIMLGVDALHIPQRLPQMIIFYSLWALFGFGLAAAPNRFSLRAYALVFVLGAVALAAALVVFAEHTTADMQHNKFPPNAVFFLFSCAWVAVFMIALKFVSNERVERLAQNPLLTPFIRSGYSLYLWQGVGYSLAYWAGRHIGAPLLVIWFAAIVLTVIFGLIASPLERIRLRLKPAR